MLKKRWWIATIVVAGVAAVLALWLWPRDYCRSAKSRYGLELPQCPEGKLRQSLRIHASRLLRGAPGTVYVTAQALYTVAPAEDWETVYLENFSVDLELIDGAGKATPVKPVENWKYELGDRYAEVILPAVTDGDYKLRATVKSKVGTDTVDLPLALYAPARVHVLTDRPLYEPGHTVLLRALVLRARDLAPIDRRPGRWIVRDPAGDTMLEEKAPAGDWGVVASNFPLDSKAAEGRWTVTWSSGEASDTVSFQVKPFTLPRFSVEASADLPFYRAGDKPKISGNVNYASGAPVANAKIEIEWRTESRRWPPPPSWADGGLPTKATTSASGRFELELPTIPADLQDRAELTANISAIDPAGDRVEGSARVLLSADAIAVSTVTELGRGLIESFNNRLYLRLTTADGRPLPGAAINVRRAWSGTDKGIDAVLDVDSVTSIQIDPGPPVNVVIPALPYRPQKAPGQLVSRDTARDLISDEGASLADMVAIDRWLPALTPCADWVVDEDGRAEVVVRVTEAGAIADGVAADAISRCVFDRIRTRRLSAGAGRLLEITFEFTNPGTAVVEASLDSPGDDLPDELSDLIDEAMIGTRRCVPKKMEEEALPWTMAFRLRENKKTFQVAWLRDRKHGQVPAALARCIETALARVELPEPADADEIGYIGFNITIPSADEEEKPQPTIMRGYELMVSADVDGERFGETRLRMTPGAVPDLRLRATPVLAKAGDEITLELIRGPEFTGKVTDEIRVEHLGNEDKIKVDAKNRTARFTIPADAKGWYEFRAHGERALVYARSAVELSVSVTPEKPGYSPGDEARLAVHTAIGGSGARAAVGLFGVDQSLTQITSVPGPDDLRRVRPEIEMNDLAFNVLDAQALTLGRIRGPSAAEATILRVASIPTPAELEVEVSGSARTELDPIAELTDRFYPILKELHAQTRIWEETAPAGDLMTPATMARLWEKALDARKAKGGAIDDFFGRRLRLHRLPADLLDLTDPRQVVVVGTRLPEDVENWRRWVERRKP